MQIKLYKDGKLPQYTNQDDACMDMFAAEDAKWVLDKGFHTCIIRLGVGCLVPREYGLFIFSRSGQGFNYSISLDNGTGVIDRSYGLNEIKCKLIYKKITLDAPEDIKKGDRVCQMALLRTPKIYLDVVEDVNVPSKDGFGSSGVK